MIMRSRVSLVEFGDMEAELVAALVLGAIEREIGLHHHGVDAGDVAPVGDDADADAWCDTSLPSDSVRRAR